MSVTEIEKLLGNIKKQRGRFFPEAVFVVLERLPFYIKIRITFEENLFIEIRHNTAGGRRSYVLIRNGVRLVGFDNLDGWHMHPEENPSAHKKIIAPTLVQVFAHFSHLVKK